METGFVEVHRRHDKFDSESICALDAVDNCAVVSLDAGGSVTQDQLVLRTEVSLAGQSRHGRPAAQDGLRRRVAETAVFPKKDKPVLHSGPFLAGQCGGVGTGRVFRRGKRAAAFNPEVGKDLCEFAAGDPRPSLDTGKVRKKFGDVHVRPWRHHVAFVVVGPGKSEEQCMVGPPRMVGASAVQARSARKIDRPRAARERIEHGKNAVGAIEGP